MKSDAIQVFAEIGYGNETICSTEIEKGDREHRIKGFLYQKMLMHFNI